jgi:dolichol-phosphate mannosyltransferase
LSKAGTYLSNWLLGTRLFDATSGYQGFHAKIVEKFLAQGLRSQAHFYQTEIRYLLRKSRFAEVPIHYRAPSPSVSKKALKNSLAVLAYYVVQRLKGKAPFIR